MIKLSRFWNTPGTCSLYKKSHKAQTELEDHKLVAKFNIQKRMLAGALNASLHFEYAFLKIIKFLIERVRMNIITFILSL